MGTCTVVVYRQLVLVAALMRVSSIKMSPSHQMSLSLCLTLATVLSVAALAATDSYCKPSTCHNGGHCSSVPGGGVHCACQAGYTGSRCDVTIAANSTRDSGSRGPVIASSPPPTTNTETLESLSQKLSAMQKAQDELTKQLAKSSNQQVAGSGSCGSCSSCESNMAARINNSMAAMQLARSPEYKGRYYFLSRRILLNHPEFQSYCSLYGGHLAEIDDQGEFDFVQNFTKTFDKQGDFIALGATDEGHEQQWTLLSGGPMNYTNWYPGEPNYSASENCLYLRKTWSKWQMRNYYCYQMIWSKFLCEIPVGGPACI